MIMTKPRSYYNKTISESLNELRSSKNGLTKSEVIKKQNKYGENIIKTELKESPLKIFLNQFKDFIVYLLLTAAAITLFIHEYTDTILILIILFFNALIGFYQEYNAKRSLDSLRKIVKIKAKVYRDGILQIVDSSELVPGDIILLEAGDKVPADGRIIEQNKFRVIESTLTGESKPVSKTHEVIKSENLPVNDQKNMVFMSTNVISGSTKILITATGMNTELGKISDVLTSTEEEMTPLQVKLDKFGKDLGKVIIGISILVFIIFILRDYINGEFTIKTIVGIFLVAVSLMVAAVPTGLPVAVTVALSVGVKRLAKKKALVRKLSSVETLGSCNIICTDKTGTLTKNEMTVTNIYLYNQEINVEGIGYTPIGTFSTNFDSLILQIGYYCNNSNIYKEDNIWKITGDPTEAAIKVVARKYYKDEKIDEFTKLGEIPFDSDRKMMSVLLEKKVKRGKDKDYYFVFSKGALDVLLEKSTHYIKNEKKYKLTNDIKKIFLEKNEEYSKKALRVLAFAYKKIRHKKDFNEEELILVGLEAMLDPPREEVKDSIAKAKEAGIDILMITGDYKETAIAIGKKVDITGKALTGKELNNLTDDELKNKIKGGYKIFARVTPNHKLRIVKVLQEEYNVVAMTGDGVNDAPALKKANIGIAVGSGTEVAKEAADLVLLDDGFQHIVNTIEEGRGIYDNIQKSIQLLLSGNLTEVLVVFLSALFNLNLPLTAMMLLWINMITDGVPAIAFSLDEYDKFIMKRKPRPLRESILPLKQSLFIIFIGTFSSILGLTLFSIYENVEYGRTILFTFIVLYETLLIYIVRSRYNIKQFSNKMLQLAVIFSILLQLIVIYTPLNKVFKVVPLDLLDWIILVTFLSLIVITYFTYRKTIEKFLFEKRFRIKIVKN